MALFEMCELLDSSNSVSISEKCYNLAKRYWEKVKCALVRNVHCGVFLTYNQQEKKILFYEDEYAQRLDEIIQSNDTFGSYTETIVFYPSTLQRYYALSTHNTLDESYVLHEISRRLEHILFDAPLLAKS